MTSTPSRPTPRRWSLALLAATALSFVLGCDSGAAHTTSPAELDHGGGQLPTAQTVDITGATSGSGSDDYRLDGEYDFSDDLASEQAPLAERELISTPARARASFGTSVDTNLGPPAHDAKGKTNEAAKKAREARAGEGDKGEPAVAEGDDQAPDHGRQIIYVAGMQISVYDLEGAMAVVEALPERYGGWIHQRTQNMVVLRLPAIQLKLAMAELAKLGVVEARTLQAQDVTAEYVDLESRITVLRETQTQLLELLGKAKTVEEALHVRKALDQVTMELEVALGRMRQLSDLIAFSTITVTLVERGPQDRIPTSNDPFRWVDSLGVEATEWR